MQISRDSKAMLLQPFFYKFSLSSSHYPASNVSDTTKALLSSLCGEKFKCSLLHSYRLNCSMEPPRHSSPGEGAMKGFSWWFSPCPGSYVKDITEVGLLAF